METSFHILSYFFFSLHCSQLLHICLGTVTEALGLTPLTEQASAPHHHFQGQVDQFLPSMTILEHLQEELFLRLIAEVMCCFSHFRQCTTFVWNICCGQTTSSPSLRESMTWKQEPQTCSLWLLLPHSTNASICELYSWLQEPFMLFNPLNSKIWF